MEGFDDYEFDEGGSGGSYDKGSETWDSNDGLWDGGEGYEGPGDYGGFDYGGESCEAGYDDLYDDYSGCDMDMGGTRGEADDGDDDWTSADGVSTSTEGTTTGSSTTSSNTAEVASTSSTTETSTSTEVNTSEVTPTSTETGDETNGLSEDEIVSNEIDGFENLIDGVNPNYDPFDPNSPYSVNCGSCAAAVEARLDGTDPNAVASSVNIPSISGMNQVTGLTQTSMSPSEIESYAQSQGPGYHGVVGFDWAGTNSGHWINVAVSDSGRVYALDGQCGVALPFSEYVNTYAQGSVNWDLSR